MEGRVADFVKAPKQDTVQHRFTAALTVSLLVHALLLSLQFGVVTIDLPGLGNPPLNVTLELPTEPLPPPDPVPPPLERLPTERPAPMQGLTVLAQAAEKAPPAAQPAPRKRPPKKAKKQTQKKVGAPRMADQPIDATRVIAQNAVESEFAMPLPEPPGTDISTLEVTEAQDGTDTPTPTTMATDTTETSPMRMIGNARAKPTVKPMRVCKP